MVSKSISFETELEGKVKKLAKESRRSFSSQVVHMVEEVLKGQASGQAQELRQYMQAQP